MEQEVMDHYRNLVSSRYPTRAGAWPLISGFNSKTGEFGDYGVIVFEHTGQQGIRQHIGMGQIAKEAVGVERITEDNRGTVRNNLMQHYGLTHKDFVFLITKGHSQIGSELDAMLAQHEYALGLVPMKVFLSHKGADKPMVREFKSTLQLLGFDPWLDEDAMNAGAELERGILKGFHESCGSVFFITKHFKDENYLSTEVNYAMQEKRSKGDKFSIITLLLDDEGIVPNLLKQYVWKKPTCQLEALREILRSLPVCVGKVYWR